MTESANPRLDVIVPIHNQLHVVRPCLESILRWTDPNEARVILVADACDKRTVEFLHTWCGRYGSARVLESEGNLGFVRSSNRGLRASTAEVAVLLNSDTCVTPGWWRKLYACLTSDPAIGVASPLSNFAPHMQVLMLPGCDYLEMAARVEETWNGQYPDVTTPEGFCFAIHRRCLAAVGYLDLAYDEGYGEESDFALRANYLGFRTVCATDTYVYHRGRATYGLERRDALYRASRRVFNERWRNKYPLQVEEFRRHDPVAAIRRRLADGWDPRLGAAFKRSGEQGEKKRRTGPVAPPGDAAAQWRAPGSLRFLCVLPTLTPYGGVLSVVNHVNDLIEAGHRVTLFSMSQITVDVLLVKTEPVFLPRDARLSDLVSPDYDVLLATSWETVPYIRQAADAMPGALPLYYVQDIEADFFADDAAIHDRALATYGDLPHRVVKTRYLQNRLAELGWSSHQIPPGMDLDLFYPRRAVSRSEAATVLAMARPGAPGDIRGFEILREVYAGLSAARPNVRLAAFGSDELPADFPCDVDLGRLGRDALPEAYSMADVFVETSRVHGFGRCGVEAMACGTACVLSASGGVEEYGRDGENCLMVPPGDAVATTAAVLRLLEDEGLRSRLTRAGQQSVQGFASAHSTSCLLDLVDRLRQEARATKLAGDYAAGRPLPVEGAG